MKISLKMLSKQPHPTKKKIKHAIIINNPSYNLLLITLLFLLSFCGAQTIDPEDILIGHGQFDSNSSLEAFYQNWQLLSKDQYNLELKSDVLKIAKLETASQVYNDGIIIQFPISKPEHLSFWCKTHDENMESCNVRLFKINETESDLNEGKITTTETSIFFRFGFYRFIKLNSQFDFLEQR